MEPNLLPRISLNSAQKTEYTTCFPHHTIRSQTAKRRGSLTPSKEVSSNYEGREHSLKFFKHSCLPTDQLRLKRRMDFDHQQSSALEGNSGRHSQYLNRSRSPSAMSTFPWRISHLEPNRGHSSQVNLCTHAVTKGRKAEPKDSLSSALGEYSTKSKLKTSYGRAMPTSSECAYTISTTTEQRTWTRSSRRSVWNVPTH